MARGTAMLFYTHIHTHTRTYARAHRGINHDIPPISPPGRAEGEDGDGGVNEAAQPTRARPACLLRIIPNLIRVRPPSVCQRAALSLRSLVHSPLAQPSLLVYPSHTLIFTRHIYSNGRTGCLLLPA